VRSGDLSVKTTTSVNVSGYNSVLINTFNDHWGC